MPYNQIRFETYYNRIHRCRFYVEEDNYAKITKSIFRKVIKQYTSGMRNGDERSFTNILCEILKTRAFTGVSHIYTEDRKTLQEALLQIAKNLDHFFHQYNVTDVFDEYLYKGRLRGSIGGRVVIGRPFTFDISFSQMKDTFFDLDMHKQNMYIYNNINDLDDDMIIFIPWNYSCFQIKYNPKAYTILRGEIPMARRSKSYRPGQHCLTCAVKNCKPRFVDNIDKLGV